MLVTFRGLRVKGLKNLQVGFQPKIFMSFISFAFKFFSKKKEVKQSRQTEVSEYFPVRRSGRKSKSVLEVVTYLFIQQIGFPKFP